MSLADDQVQSATLLHPAQSHKQTSWQSGADRIMRQVTASSHGNRVTTRLDERIGQQRNSSRNKRCSKFGLSPNAPDGQNSMRVVTRRLQTCSLCDSAPAIGYKDKPRRNLWPATLTSRNHPGTDLSLLSWWTSSTISRLNSTLNSRAQE